MHGMNTPMDYHVWGAMLEHHQRYTPKPSNTAELKTVSLTIWNDFPREFVDRLKQSYHFAKESDRVLR